MNENNTIEDRIKALEESIREKDEELAKLREESENIRKEAQRTREEKLEGFAYDFIERVLENRDNDNFFLHDRLRVGEYAETYGHQLDFDLYEGGYPSINVVAVHERKDYDSVRPVDDRNNSYHYDERVAVTFTVPRDNIMDILDEYGLNDDWN